MLEYVADGAEVMFPLTRKGAAEMKYKNLPEVEEYFPSVVKQVANKLLRQGFVEKRETAEGLVVRITEKGKTKVLKYQLDKLAPVKTRWDGVWRLVFFDIAEMERGRRDRLRKALRQLGMEQMQESVFVSPYDVFDQVKFLREVLDVPHGVKLAKVAWLENEEDLKEIFGLG
jgi:phenylacetic acid degradation operon negative regulatory protein